MEKKSSVKQTIEQNALRLFCEKGYEGAAVSELTEAANITKPTLYYYFGSKEGLFDTVCSSHYEKLNRIVNEAAAYKEDIFLALTNLAKAYFSFAQENEAFFRIALTNLTMPSSSAVFKFAEKYHFRQYDIIEAMFRGMAKENGNLRGKSKTLTWSFLGTINSYISLYFNGIGGQKLNDKTVKELVSQFMRGIFS